MENLDRAIEETVSHYGNSVFEPETLALIGKAALLDNIKKNQAENPDYNVFTDHNPGWILRSAINHFTKICERAAELYGEDASKIQKLMEYNAHLSCGETDVEPPFSSEELDRIAPMLERLEQDYTDSHDAFSELGAGVRLTARIYSRMYPNHSEEEYFNAGMEALHELSQKYQTEDEIMRHKPEAYIQEKVDQLV